jgi:hypothetical protein
MNIIFQFLINIRKKFSMNFNFIFYISKLKCMVTKLSEKIIFLIFLKKNYFNFIKIKIIKNFKENFFFLKNRFFILYFLKKLYNLNKINIMNKILTKNLIKNYNGTIFFLKILVVLEEIYSKKIFKFIKLKEKKEKLIYFIDINYYYFHLWFSNKFLFVKQKGFYLLKYLKKIRFKTKNLIYKIDEKIIIINRIQLFLRN